MFHRPVFLVLAALACQTVYPSGAGSQERLVEIAATASEPSRIAPRPLKHAMSAARAGRWEAAAKIAMRDGPAASALLEWMRLREGLGTPDDVLQFLEMYPDWPGRAALRARSEVAMIDATPEQVVEFFDSGEPLSGLGVLAYARALKTLGRQGDGEVSLALAWVTLDLTSDEHDQFIAAYPELLAPHHAARLDMATWRGLRDVEKMLPLVDAPLREVIQTRLMIERGQSGADKRLATLATEARSDAHIAFALFNRHLDKGRTDEAIAVLLRQSRREAGLGEPERWARQRRDLARDRMRDGAGRTAYDIASVHGLVEGSSYADLEWLSGYLALTYMDDPALAVGHFRNLLDAVKTPISLGRAGYWLGRAEEALGNEEAAQIAYELGALHQTSYYGLLAAERGGFPFDKSLAGQDEVSDWRSAAFTRSLVYQAGVLLYVSGEVNLAERFFTHLASELDATELAKLGAAVEALGSPHLQVMIGKAAAKRGLTVPAPYYALHPMIDLDLPVPMELALAIARRESEFDTYVTSGAGAMGLMQLMPGTATEMANALSESNHSRARLYADWAYNARLGSAYLARMARLFDGNIVMMSAAYNAGPGRPPRWMSRFGDPRGGAIDMIDWIEHVPFSETRNYIMRVAESLPVYRARLGLEPHPVPFSEELSGNTFQSNSD
ncbi:MAG: lytic transglycosylase domain-containing protein [Pseudomonadota bacterium]